MNRVVNSIFYILLLWLLSDCKQLYTPPAITAITNYLVVEGFINIADSIHITLSRTVNVMNATVGNPELKATVTIENNTGGSYPLTEIGNGVYGAPNYNLSVSGQYRIRIRTLKGSTYASDFVQPTIAPPTDSLLWTDKGNGVRISLDAHGLQNSTRYYLWDYTETWEIYTFNISYSVYNSSTKTIVSRTPAQQVHHCWGTARAFLLNSTIRLSRDIVQNQKITFIPIGSEKLSNEYSIIVNQYGLSKDAYDYYTLLKKNTEQLGSIFDATPSSPVGNIQNVNKPAEPVIGFIGAGTVSSTRIFINRFTQLPYEYYYDYFTFSPYNQFHGCDTLALNIGTFAIQPEIAVPIGSGLGVEPPGCLDCTINGGTNVKPAFWP